MIETLFDTLADDATLQTLAPGGVHTSWAVEGVLPRVILGFSGAADGVMNNGGIDIDVFFEQGDLAGGESVVKQIRKLLDWQYFETDETGKTLRAFYFTDQIIPDKDLGHWSMIFNLRYHRVTEAHDE
jgi:hypothetical protein